MNSTSIGEHLKFVGQTTRTVVEENGFAEVINIVELKASSYLALREREESQKAEAQKDPYYPDRH